MAVVLATLTILIAALGASVAPSVAAASDISGSAYYDANRDASQQAGETPLAGKRIYLFDAAGNYLKNVPTDAAGRYAFTGLADTRYQVRYGTIDWWDLWRDWVPTTTGSERPHVTLDLAGSATVNFGWRQIVRSTDPAAPLATFVAPDGLRIESFNDAVDPKRIYDALLTGTLRGGEGRFTTIRFDIRPDHICDIGASKVNGVWGSYRALCYISYTGWLDERDVGLFHEYGHAWSLYHAYVVQQDPALTDYLEVRGLTTDPRLRTSSSWNPKEMIAEDYRQLFGSAYAASWPQDNEEIPPASQVAGLREYLSGAFTQAPAPIPPTPPPPPPAAPVLHVGDLKGQAAKAGSKWSAVATTTIRDAAAQPVAGAVVTLRWSAGKTSGQLTCTTSTTGACDAKVDLTSKVDSATLSVTAVAKDGATYDGQANAVDAVTVARPR
jgi:hypothetical protein